VTTIASGSRARRPDVVAGEEPLEIRLAGPSGRATPIAVTMRTPGQDFELAVGFLFSEGLLSEQSELRSARYCDLDGDEAQDFNVVTVTTSRLVPATLRRRQSTVGTSCGICGTATLEDLKDRCPPLPAGGRIRVDVLTALPGRLRARQRVFASTGGLHAAGLFDSSGAMLAVREDVGRHNAVDKLVGWAAMQHRLPLAGCALAVSGRVSFEIVQKAAVAGIPVLVAVSAPSSLAVATAQALDMTLAGFVRDGRANLYAGEWRVEEG